MPPPVPYDYLMIALHSFPLDIYRLSSPISQSVQIGLRRFWTVAQALMDASQQFYTFAYVFFVRLWLGFGWDSGEYP
jgi:hypothetical protein